MVDSHCHLNFQKFEADVAEVVERAVKAGVTTIVNVGTSIDSSQKVIELAEQFDSCWAVVGVHPHHADKVEIESERWIETIEQLAKHSKVIAIGETGMDYFSYQSNGIVDPKIQEKVFREQIELSIHLKLPLQIHNRHAGSDVVKILKDYKAELQAPAGVFHCFAGDRQLLLDVLNLGFYIGFDGNITYPGLAPGENTALTDILSETPLNRILIETDSPYLTPIPLRGQRNEPKNAIIVGAFLANQKGVSEAEMEKITTENFFSVFSRAK